VRRAKRGTLITYLAIYIFAISSAVRLLTSLREDPFLWLVSALLAVYLLLMALEPWIFRRSRLHTQIYLAMQTALVIVLAILPPASDYFATLFFSLALQAMVALSVRVAFGWIVAFAAATSVLLIDAWGWAGGLPLIMIYTAAGFFFGSYAAFIRQAEAARSENQRLLAELRLAHEQLQTSSAQAEELAVVQERNRLARNLHDSVSQTIFSMTLLAEAVRIVCDRDALGASQQLDMLGELAQSALSEMRSLIFELRPASVGSTPVDSTGIGSTGIGEKTHGSHSSPDRG
jgi:signal transduction histidine kinase